MSYLSDDVRNALDSARSVMARRARQLSVRSGGASYPISRLSETGFVISLGDAPRLRGVVDLFDGNRHLSNGLITKVRQSSDEWIYEYQWNVSATVTPALDYVRDDDGADATASLPE